MKTVQAIIERVRAEFNEMPGLRLTRAQVQRLCGIEMRLCDVVLASLIERNVLCRNVDGTYMRVTDGPRSQHHQALRTRGASSDPAATRMRPRPDSVLGGSS